MDVSVIYLTIFVALFKCKHCKKYQDLEKLTLTPKTSLRDYSDVRSLIECLVLCKQIGDECYAISWKEAGMEIF